MATSKKQNVSPPEKVAGAIFLAERRTYVKSLMCGTDILKCLSQKYTPKLDTTNQTQTQHHRCS